MNAYVNNRRSDFFRKLMPGAVVRRKFVSPTRLKVHPYRPDVRSWVLEAFPSSGEDRIRGYVRRAIGEDLLTPFDRELERVDGIPLASEVPGLLYIWNLPTMPTAVGGP